MNVFIIIPSNIFSDIPSLREKTVRVANLVRTLILFRVRQVVIFKYKERDDEFLKLMDFFRTPSYLRRYAFKKEKVFRFVGNAPPIRAFYEEDKKYRYGIVLKNDGKLCLINSGLKDLIVLSGVNVAEGQLMKLVNDANGWRLATKEEDHHFGFNTFYTDDLIGFLFKMKTEKKLIIATSRYGKTFRTEDLMNLKRDSRIEKGICLLFGSPKEGLFEIFKSMNRELSDYVDHVFNMFPNQGVKTIRTDEAIMGTLSIIN